MFCCTFHMIVRDKNKTAGSVSVPGRGITALCDVIGDYFLELCVSKHKGWT